MLTLIVITHCREAPPTSRERRGGARAAETMSHESRREGLILIDSELAVGEVGEAATEQRRWKASGSRVERREVAEESGKRDEHGKWYSKV